MRGRNGHGRGRRGRHLLHPTLLFLMHQGPAHGYDLIDRLGNFGIVELDPSLVYRVLRDMEADGLISSTWDEEKTQGPPRRVYQLTQDGDHVLKNYLTDLDTTRQRIDQLINAYERHMQSTDGKFHKKGGD